MEEFASKAGVTAVIPTRHRPGMVVAAVKSALAQTAHLCEVIVVIDGPDAATVAALSPLQADGRLRVVALTTPVGGAEARNIGAREAQGSWIGFLDDDDLWLPHKLAIQMAEAGASTAAEPVVASAVLARGPSWQAVWPRRLYKSSESMSEYLFCRSGWTYGAALLQTSTLLASRALLLRIPFAPGLKKHQDWDWLLRLEADPDVEVRQVAEPLVVFHVEGARASVGRAPDWEFSRRWARERRDLLTARAYSAFLATECAPQAARARATLRDRAGLLHAVVCEGSATPKLCFLCVCFLLVPQRVRRLLREAARLGRVRMASLLTSAMPR